MDFDCLFVYGTLRRDCGVEVASRLSENADFIGMGYLQGRLYDVDHYPGVVPCTDARSRVLGELYRLRAPERILAELDVYEECSELFARPYEYKRMKLTIARAEGGWLLAWVYVYNRPVTHLQQIGSGDYVRYQQQRSRVCQV